MTEYEFTLKLALPGSEADPERHVPALESAGCDDAIIGVGKRGRIALEFARSARSSDAAVRSALADVRKAIPGARLIEALPDLVGLSDVAELAGCTRQNLRKLSMSDAAFPTAVHAGNPELFHLAEILRWVRSSGRAEVSQALLDIAETNRQLNIAGQVGRLPRRRNLFSELGEGFAALSASRTGKQTLRTHVLEARPTPTIKAKELASLRRKLDVSRPILAGYLRTNVRTLENWEQGRAKPNAQAALLIKLVAAYPDTVKKLASL